ncbi:MAG: insulinase family protein [Gemmataceae bacterium]|nr:insulinase family protein [Gemmataceae bacterium]
MPFHHLTLPNGLQVLGETNPGALSVAVGFFVRTGARDERDNESGVSHFLEHMAFKGTERRDAIQVNRDFDRIGADNNAFTSEELTVYHASVLPEYLPQVFDILADILRPALREDDFLTEKNVIKDEIARYEVRPEWLVYDISRRRYFGEHPLGRSILGTRESIDALTREQMLDYFRRRYAASNIIVSVAGNFDWNELVALTERHCGDWNGLHVPPRQLSESPCRAGLELISRERFNQEYVMMWAPGPAANSPCRFAAAVLDSIIGDYTGSRLYWELVDPGLVESADFSYLDAEGAGAYLVSFICSPEKTASNLEIVRRVLRQVQEHGVTDEELRTARTRLASREVRSHERTHRRMLSIGDDWIYLNQYRTLDDELAAIDSVDAKAIRELLERYPLRDFMTVALGPLAKF